MRIEALNRSHVRSTFDCESPALTDYLKRRASQDMRKKLAVCFVLLGPDSQEVSGYYTLSTASLGREEIPEPHRARVPESYQVPLILLGRLARHRKLRGSGTGGVLLADALLRCRELSRSSVGAMAVVVDPIDQAARAFCARHGFLELPTSARMFLPMRTIEQLP